MTRAEKQYDRERYEFDTETRLLLNDNDTGALSDDERVTSDYRYLKPANKAIGYEKEPDTKAPRSLRDRIDETKRDRDRRLIRQILAEDYKAGSDYSYDDIDLIGLLEGANEGSLDEEKMRSLKTELEGIILYPETRETQMAVIKPILDQMKERLALIEAPRRLADILEALKTASKERKHAIDAREWGKVNSLNQTTLILANEIKTVLDLLRSKDPDRLYRIIPEIYSVNPEAVNLYKKALIDYAGSHNSYQFSSKVLEELRKLSNEEKRGKFPSALHKAYCNRPQYDNVFAFLENASGIPGDRLMDVMHRAD